MRVKCASYSQFFPGTLINDVRASNPAKIGSTNPRVIYKRRACYICALIREVYPRPFKEANVKICLWYSLLSAQVFNFFGLSVHSTVTAFLDSHTKTNKGQSPLSSSSWHYHQNIKQPLAFLRLKSPTGDVSSTCQDSKSVILTSSSSISWWSSSSSWSSWSSS